ncbi:hypothetical protein PTNB29_10407 [Pyrenophora teres f. teres]|nr:hypothetical protein PTNB29_10407 [Pyrenophora teres f. teres]
MKFTTGTILAILVAIACTSPITPNSGIDKAPPPPQEPPPPPPPPLLQATIKDPTEHATGPVPGAVNTTPAVAAMPPSRAEENLLINLHPNKTKTRKTLLIHAAWLVAASGIFLFVA